MDLAARVVDLDVAAGGAARADRRRRVELPDAHREPEVLRRQRADRADVDGVERVGVVELVAGRRGQHLVVPARRHLQLVVVGHLVADADAARAEDAALLIEDDGRTEVDDLLLVDLDAVVARQLGVPVEVLLLQHALAGLVADRAVDRVVDEGELQHLPADIKRARRAGHHLHLVGHRRVAGGDRLRLTLDVDQALAADRRRGEARVVAEERDVGAVLVAGLDDHRPLGDLQRLAVDDHGDGFGRCGGRHRPCLICRIRRRSC